MRPLLAVRGQGIPLYCLTVVLLAGQVRVTHAAGAAAAVANCEIAPRPVAEIIALLTPPPGSGTPWPGQPIPSLPVGEPTDAATTAAITEVVAELEACVNGGDLLRFHSLFSDDWFRRLPMDEEIVAELSALETATPSPVPEGRRSQFYGPWDVTALDDGRVRAAVEWFGSGSESSPDPARTKVLVFIHQEGRWLIDEIIERVSVPQCAHPVAVAEVVGPPPGVNVDAWPKNCGQ